MKMERKSIQFKALNRAFLIFLALAFSACSLIGGGGDDGDNAPAVTVFGHQQNLGGDAFLVCTQECSDMGFCGTRDTGERVVLLNTQGPSTLVYDLFMQHNTPVSIAIVEQRLAVLQISQALQAATYYLVSNPDLGQGWVAGWCVGQ
jgi:hypothetical protein